MGYFIHAISLSFFILTNCGAIAQNKKFSITLSAGQFINNPVSGRGTTHDFYWAYSVKQTSRFSPQLSLNLEAKVVKQLRVGLQIHYLTSVTSERKINEIYPFPSDSLFHERGKGIAFGSDFNLKYFLYLRYNMNIYVNGSGGLLIARENISEPAGVRQPYLATKLWLLYHLGMGIQYFPYEYFGFLGEFGYK